jgi:hypothetical protein
MVMLDIAYREGQGPAAGAIRLRSTINLRAAELMDTASPNWYAPQSFVNELRA